jgi:predicted GNAT family acetyltransferase
MLTALDPAAVIAAIERTFVHHTLAYVRVGGGQGHEGRHLTWVESPVPLGAFNGVLATALADGEADAAIAAITARFRARRTPMYWWATPSTRPRDLAQRLIAHGLAFAGTDVGMAAVLDGIEARPPPPGVTIERVRDAATMRAWLHAFGQGFGLTDTVLEVYSGVVTGAPPDRHPAGSFYLARLDSEPVGTAGLFRDAGVANVVQVCTVPSARRRGIGDAVTRAALEDARAAGYRVAVLRASESGAPLYARMGFARYCTLDAYRPVPAP